MVEGGQGSDAAALARLELLSNTAMLKVMDKKGNTVPEHGYHDPNASMMKPPMQRPCSPTGREHQHPEIRGESPAGHSHHSYGEDPHQSQRRHGFAPPPHTYQYMRYDHSRDPGSQEAHYTRNESPPGYSRGPHGELHHQDNAKTSSSMVSHVSSDHLPSVYQRPYGRTMKENVPPYAFRPPTSGYNPHQHLGLMHGRVPEPIYGAPRVSPEIPRPLIIPGGHMDPHHLSYEALARDNHHIREQLKDKDTVVSSLQQRVNYLESQISELRQLPTGKISHIPVDDMIKIMQEYGSEVSNQTLPKRKGDIKKASIVRQFRRWNAEFFRYFIHVNGEWVPKLGNEGEHQRRAEKRRMIKQNGGTEA